MTELDLTQKKIGETQIQMEHQFTHIITYDGWSFPKSLLLHLTKFNL